MNKEFVKYEQALALKELGFDERCFGGYEKDFSNKYFRFRGASETDIYMKNSDFKITSTTVCAPLYQQAFRWFREKYGLMHIINPYYFTCEIDFLNKRIVNKELGDFIPHNHLLDIESEEINHSSYEEAELACLKKLIEICKNK
jgi:hypothetical protein